VAQLLLDFQGGCRALYLQRVIDVRHLIARKFHVDDGADDLNDTSTTHVWFLCLSEPFLNRGSAADDFRNLLSDRSLTGLVVDQLQIADELAGVVGRALHGNHPGGLLGRAVLDHALVDLGLDETNQQGIQQLLGVRLVEVVPQTLARGLAGVQRCQGQQLVDVRLLGHGVDELVRHQVEAIDATGVEGVQHDLDVADQVIDGGRLAQVADGRHHVAAEAAEEARTLVADHAQVGLDLLVVPVLHVLDQGLEQVDVQAAAQATVGGDDDVADALDRALHHERMAVFRVGVGQVADHLTDPLRVGAAGSHAHLCLAHLADRHLFHGAGDLLRALDARNLAANLFCACHFTPYGLAGGSLAAPAAAYQDWVALNASMPALMPASISSLKSPFSLIFASRSAFSRWK